MILITYKVLANRIGHELDNPNTTFGAFSIEYCLCGIHHSKLVFKSRVEKHEYRQDEKISVTESFNFRFSKNVKNRVLKQVKSKKQFIPNFLLFIKGV